MPATAVTLDTTDGLRVRRHMQLRVPIDASPIPALGAAQSHRLQLSVTCARNQYDPVAIFGPLRTATRCPRSALAPTYREPTLPPGQ